MKAHLLISIEGKEKTLCGTKVAVMCVTEDPAGVTCLKCVRSMTAGQKYRRRQVRKQGQVKSTVELQRMA